MTLGWGLVGIGKLVEVAIAPAIQRQAGSSIAAACSRSLSRAQTFVDAHGGTAYDDYAAMLADPAVDIVYIATPNSLHREQTIAALSAGKHVLVEKPMALTVADGRDMVAAAADAQRLLAVGFHLRHKASNLAAREAIADGRLGRVFFGDISVGAGKNVFPYDTWRADPALAGGGTLLHQGTHAIDLLGFLTGQRIVEVSCTIDLLVAEEVFAATCVLGDGMIATLSSHQLHAGTRPDWVMMGEQAWLEGKRATTPAAGDELMLHEGRDTTVLAESPVPAYDSEVDAFVAAVQQRGQVNGSGIDGLRNVAVVEALYRSARERRRVEVEQIDD